MKLQEPMKTVKALVGPQVVKSERCCGESGTLGVTRPDISTQVRFRKEEELRKGEAALRAAGGPGRPEDPDQLPSCLQGLSRYQDDLTNGLLEADYIVVEMARKILGEAGWKTTWRRPTAAASSACWSEASPRARAALRRHGCHGVKAGPGRG
jgi:hypothetical protein